MTGDRIVWACVGAHPVDDGAGRVPASYEVAPPIVEKRGGPF
jgi:hypothetical protein